MATKEVEVYHKLRVATPLSSRTGQPVSIVFNGVSANAWLSPIGICHQKKRSESRDQYISQRPQTTGSIAIVRHHPKPTGLLRCEIVTGKHLPVNSNRESTSSNKESIFRRPMAFEEDYTSPIGSYMFNQKVIKKGYRGGGFCDGPSKRPRPYTSHGLPTRTARETPLSLELNVKSLEINKVSVDKASSKMKVISDEQLERKQQQLMNVDAYEVLNKNCVRRTKSAPPGSRPKVGCKSPSLYWRARSAYHRKLMTPAPDIDTDAGETPQVARGSMLKPLLYSLESDIQHSAGCPYQCKGCFKACLVSQDYLERTRRRRPPVRIRRDYRQRTMMKKDPRYILHQALAKNQPIYKLVHGFCDEQTVKDVWNDDRTTRGRADATPLHSEQVSAEGGTWGNSELDGTVAISVGTHSQDVSPNTSDPESDMTETRTISQTKPLREKLTQTNKNEITVNKSENIVNNSDIIVNNSDIIVNNSDIIVNNSDNIVNKNEITVNKSEIIVNKRVKSAEHRNKSVRLELEKRPKSCSAAEPSSSPDLKPLKRTLELDQFVKETRSANSVEEKKEKCENAVALIDTDESEETCQQLVDVDDDDDDVTQSYSDQSSTCSSNVSTPSKQGSTASRTSLSQSDWSVKDKAATYSDRFGKTKQSPKRPRQKIKQTSRSETRSESDSSEDVDSDDTVVGRNNRRKVKEKRKRDLSGCDQSSESPRVSKTENSSIQYSTDSEHFDCSVTKSKRSSQCDSRANSADRQDSQDTGDSASIDSGERSKESTTRIQKRATKKNSIKKRSLKERSESEVTASATENVRNESSSRTGLPTPDVDTTVSSEIHSGAESELQFDTSSRHSVSSQSSGSSTMSVSVKSEDDSFSLDEESANSNSSASSDTTEVGKEVQRSKKELRPKKVKGSHQRHSNRGKQIESSENSGEEDKESEYEDPESIKNQGKSIADTEKSLSDTSDKTFDGEKRSSTSGKCITKYRKEKTSSVSNVRKQRTVKKRNIRRSGLAREGDEDEGNDVDEERDEEETEDDVSENNLESSESVESDSEIDEKRNRRPKTKKNKTETKKKRNVRRKSEKTIRKSNLKNIEKRKQKNKPAHSSNDLQEDEKVSCSGSDDEKQNNVDVESEADDTQSTDGKCSMSQSDYERPGYKEGHNTSDNDDCSESDDNKARLIDAETDTAGSDCAASGGDGGDSPASNHSDGSVSRSEDESDPEESGHGSEEDSQAKSEEDEDDDDDDDDNDDDDDDDDDDTDEDSNA